MSKNINYKDTLNLPKTKMPMKANLAEREPEYLNFWQDKDIYKRIEESLKDKPKYILHDGPPYANGRIHMGHVLNKTLKDIILKYRTLRGYLCPFVPGWDCHGLPVEHQLFKELSLTKDEISQNEFRRKAKDYALKFVKIQKEEFKRLGIFADWDNSYLTLSNSYEAEILRSFAKLAEGGFLYRGRKPVNWCPHCETALAEAEVEYAEDKSPSIYVKFKLSSKDKLLNKLEIPDLNEELKQKQINLIVWTTTPWTLVSNIAVALNPKLNYDLIDVGGEIWILADSLVDNLMGKIDKKDYRKITTLKSETLELLKTDHPFINRKSIIIEAEYVSQDEGTGCVHIAPGHGQEDYQCWFKYKDKIDDFNIIMPVDAKGKFNKTTGEFAGLKVHEADKKIIRKLKDNNKLVKDEEIVHSYPHCWRCKAPIIFRATKQWFMNVDHNGFRDKMKELINDKVEWIPKKTRERILSMINSRPDWCLSRQRYWGVPIPVFYCRECGQPLLDKDIINHLADMVEKEGLDIWFNKKSEQLLPDNTRCPKCSHDKFDKESDILDVWFDSGISHQAVLRKRKDLSFPADLYLEGSDQHRGWFQTSLITALAIENQAPYKSVLTHGFIVGAQGKKMSKSEGNAMSPDKVIKDLGADILRLWVASSDYHREVSLSDTILKRLTEAYRKIRNTMRFMLSNIDDFDIDKDRVKYEKLNEVDRWALNQAAELYNNCIKYYDSFHLHKATHQIYNFCTVKMSSFYLDILKDRLYTYGKNSMERRSSQTVLYELLNLLIKLISPVLSFTAEETWSYMKPKVKEDSVFLSNMNNDETVNSWIDEKLNNTWDRLLEIRETVLKALENKRTEKVIGNSLEAEVSLFVNDAAIFELLENYKEQLDSIFIVSKVNIKKTESLPEDVFRGKNKENIAVKVKKSEASKCPRCWRYVDTIGRDAEHKQVCKRCAEVIKNMQ